MGFKIKNKTKSAGSQEIFKTNQKLSSGNREARGGKKKNKTKQKKIAIKSEKKFFFFFFVVVVAFFHPAPSRPPTFN